MSRYTSQKYCLEEWSIEKLTKYVESSQLNLQPHYQRNDVWSSKMQRELIDTIATGLPLPNFFVRRIGAKYEMVDGQQRSRAIRSFLNGDISDLQGSKYSDLTEKQVDYFRNYTINIVALLDMTDKDTEDFYVLVNCSGTRLNRPELKKAEYYSSRFLKLCQNICEQKVFLGLQLFSEKSAERMNDIDFVSELCAFLKYGISEKKESVDKLYEQDVTEEEATQIFAEATRIFNVIQQVSVSSPISKTRLKQKGDFYTLFCFLHEHSDYSYEQLKCLFEFILGSMTYIRPSQENCETFKNYALACVSQSNSKEARDSRLNVFNELFYNNGSVLTAMQKDVVLYLKKHEKLRVKEIIIGTCLMLSLGEKTQ